MKHSILRKLMLIAVLLTSSHAFAYDFIKDGIYYNITSESDRTVEMTKTTKTGSLEIPKKVIYNSKTYSVTSIGKSAFSHYRGLTSLTIPNSIKSIGDNAFDACVNLSNLHIEDGTDTLYIGKSWAFDYYTDEYVEDPLFSGTAYNGGVTISQLYLGRNIKATGYKYEETYKKSLFEDNKLKTVIIGNQVTRIEDYAFYGIYGLTSVTIGNSVTSIGNKAFSSCGDLYINDLVAWCNIDFANSVSNPQYYAKNLYLNNEKVTNLEIPNTITEIKKYAFYDCDGLTSVTIGDSVTSIGESAFYGCSSLASVTIPNSVTSIGKYAFSYCSGLTRINISDLVAWCNIDFANGEANPLYYAKKLYLNNEKVTNLVIPNTITKIKKYTFYGCSGLTSVTIPNFVTSIGRFAFYDCDGLTSVTIPNSVTSIGEDAFSYCSGLTSIVVENGNTVYDSRDNCNAIIETTSNTLIFGCNTTIIPNSVTSIGSYAFYGCSGLTSVTIPNSVTSIGQGAFYGCSGLTGVTIPNSVTSIGGSAFSKCSGLTSVTIPNSVTSIGKYAFSYCSGLTEIYCKATNPPTCNTKYQTFSDETLQYVTLYVPTGCKSVYESVDPWRNFWNIEEYEFSGVESTLVDDVNVSVENGNIVIGGADNANVDVYSVNGQYVYSGNATTIPVTAKGLYIVKVGNTTHKIIL